MERISRDQNLLDMAHLVARRGTCSRLHVGAVFAKDGRIVATGYNGAPHGMDHCIHEELVIPRDGIWVAPPWLEKLIQSNKGSDYHLGHLFVPGTHLYWDGKAIQSSMGHNPNAEYGCTVAEHAERNAIYYAARHGIHLGGTELFVSHQPCYDCARALVSLGIERVVYTHPYRKTAGLELLKSRQIEVIAMPATVMVG